MASHNPLTMGSCSAKPTDDIGDTRNDAQRHNTISDCSSTGSCSAKPTAKPTDDIGDTRNDTMSDCSSTDSHWSDQSDQSAQSYWSNCLCRSDCPCKDNHIHNPLYSISHCQCHLTPAVVYNTIIDIPQHLYQHIFLLKTTQSVISIYKISDAFP